MDIMVVDMVIGHAYLLDRTLTQLYNIERLLQL